MDEADGGSLKNKVCTKATHEMSIEEEDDEYECRICRGPAEKGCPLVRPCKCAGSIGLTHQHCLKEWLNVTKKNHCELCKVVFKFSPKYAEGTPKYLPLHEVILGILHRATKKWLPFALRISTAIVLWICALPLTTAYLYYGWIHGPSSLSSRWRWNILVKDTMSGAVVVGVIIISFLSLMSFVDFLRFRWQNRENNNANAADLNAAVAAAAAAAAAENAGDADGEEEEEDFFHFEEPGGEGDIMVEREYNDDVDQNDARPRENGGDGMRNDAEIQFPPGDNNRFEPRFEPMDPVMGQEEGMDIHVALDELLGLRGPVIGLIRNLLWLLAFNTTYLGIFVYLPYTIGGTFLSLLITPDVFKDPLDVHEPFHELRYTIWLLNKRSLEKSSLFQLPDFARLIAGYLAVSSFVFIGHKIMSLRNNKKPLDRNSNTDEMINNAMHPDENFGQHEAVNIHNGIGFGPGEEEVDADVASLKISMVFDCVKALVKVCVLLLFKMLILPLILGIWLDTKTLSLFDAEVNDRVEFASGDLFGAIFIHWVLGITFMLLVTMSMLQLREVLHPELLAKVIRPQEPQPDLLGNLLNENGTTHIARLFLSLGMYFMILSIFVWLPAHIVVTSGIADYLPFFRPKFWYVLLPQLQVPIELIAFHLSMLAFLEKYKNHIGEMQHQYLNWICGLVNLSQYILPKSISHFKLIGIRPLYSCDVKPTHLPVVTGDTAQSNSEKELSDNSSSNCVDPFWRDVARGGANAHNMISAGMKEFHVSSRYERGITKRGGQRSLTTQSHIRIQSERHPGGKLCLPTALGPYRLRAHMKNTRRNVNAAVSNNSASIEVWEEVLGSNIHRPPEGWDDLVDGGAEVQGRWAWGDEKKSDIEEGVGKRVTFTSHENKLILILKLSTVLLVSWFFGLVFFVGAINIPVFIGRNFFKMLYISDSRMHDPIAFAVGCVLLLPLTNLLAVVIANANNRSGLTKFCQWVVAFRRPESAAKIFTVITTVACWSIVSPLFTGFLFLLCFVAGPDSWAEMKLHVDIQNIFKVWVVGNIIFHLWAFLSYVGVFKLEFWAKLVARENLDQDGNIGGAVVNEVNERQPTNVHDTANSSTTRWQGENGRIHNFMKMIRPVLLNWEWDKVDQKVFLSDLFYPIVCRLLITLCVPIIVVISFRTFFHILCEGRDAIQLPFIGDINIGVFCMSLYYIGLLIVLIAQAALVFKGPLTCWFRMMHNAARNDRYLIGEILMNYEP